METCHPQDGERERQGVKFLKNLDFYSGEAFRLEGRTSNKKAFVWKHNGKFRVAETRLEGSQIAFPPIEYDNPEDVVKDWFIDPW